MNALWALSGKQFPHRYDPIQTFFVLCALVAAIPATTQAQETTNCTQRPPGLVAWWPGDGTALDVAVTNHRTLQRASYANGLAGQSFVFNGSSGNVAVPDSPAGAFGSNSFTIGLWAPSGSQAFVASDTRSGKQNKWTFSRDGGQLRLHINGTPGSVNIGSSRASPDQIQTLKRI